MVLFCQNLLISRLKMTLMLFVIIMLSVVCNYIKIIFNIFVSFSSLQNIVNIVVKAILCNIVKAWIHDIVSTFIGDEYLQNMWLYCELALLSSDLTRYFAGSGIPPTRLHGDVTALLWLQGAKDEVLIRLFWVLQV